MDRKRTVTNRREKPVREELMKMKALFFLSRTGYHVSTTQWAAHDKDRAENRKNARRKKAD